MKRAIVALWLAGCASPTATRAPTAITGHPSRNATVAPGTNASAEPPSSGPPPSLAHSFVTRNGHCLVRDGHRLRVVGSSALSMQEDAARELAGHAWARGRMMAGFDSAARAGVDVLRVAAFNDGPRDDAAIQVHRGELSDVGIRGLDRVVAEAGRRNVMLVMVLSNYWVDYGGLAQYLRWRSLPEDDRGLVFSRRDLFEDVRNYALLIANRVNSYNGLRYADDPTILAWEIMNEPRGEGLTDRGETHTQWLANVAHAIHQAAPHQLVVAGDEGFDLDTRGYDMTYWNSMVEARVLGEPRRQSWRMVVNNPEIDVATLHFYPEVWGVRLGEEDTSGPHWIHDHAMIAAAANKPVLFEEFGLGDTRRHGPRLSLEYRRHAYEMWFEASWREPTFAAVMPWGMTYPGQPGQPDGYAWGAHTGDDDDYAGLVHRWSGVFAGDTDLSECASAAAAVRRASPPSPP